MSTELATFSKLDLMSKEISETTDLLTIARIQDEANAFAVWVRARENGQELAKKAKVIVLTAERRIGELSLAIPRGGRGRDSKGTGKLAKMQSLGFTANRVQKAEQLAKVPPEKFEAYIAESPKPSVQGALVGTGALEVRPATLTHLSVWRQIAYDALWELETAINRPGDVKRSKLAQLRERCRQATRDQGREDRRSVYYRNANKQK